MLILLEYYIKFLIFFHHLKSTTKEYLYFYSVLSLTITINILL